MRVSVVKANACEVGVDLLVLPVFSGKKGPRLKHLKHLLASVDGLAALRDGSVCSGDFESTALLPGAKTKAKWVLIAGLGKAEDLSLDRLRKAAGAAAQRAAGIKARRVAVLADECAGGGFDARTVARCLVEGFALGSSKDGAMKSKAKKRTLPALKLITGESGNLKALRAGAKEGDAFGEGCLFTRRLVDLPGNHLTPTMLCDEARRMAADEGYGCRIYGVAQLRRMKMNGILGVSRGSREEPRLVVLETKKRRRSAPDVVLVGKGITFDAGGISLKPPAKMGDMKGDMAGAAAVLGAALTIARLKVPVNLTVVVPAAENLPDGNALKPGDVLTMASGKTVEVLNTDAEGRLILGDAMHFATKRKPDYVIDVATLTGACEMALGEHFAGLMSPSAELIDVLQQAGGETFERVWTLPLIDEHYKAIESKVADIKNLGGRTAGAMTAGAFVGEFVVDKDATAWAHLDIAGTSSTEAKSALGPVGATGFGSRLLARAVEILAE